MELGRSSYSQPRGRPASPPARSTRAGGRQRDGDRAFGKAVDGSQRARAKSISAEALDESAKGVNADWLGAVRDEAKRTQVETIEVGFINLAETKFEREIWRGGDCAAVTVTGP